MKECPANPPQKAKKQNHANIPCPIENCARFTYGKLPDHLTKRHGLTGKERDAVNEQQRKRFFNGELCQVRFLKEAAIVELWGDDYNDPKIKKKIHDSYAMVKIRIIPISATTNRILPLTEQDANVLTNYNARTIEKPQRTPAKKKRKNISYDDSCSSSDTSVSPKRRKSCESSDGEENAMASNDQVLVDKADAFKQKAETDSSEIDTPTSSEIDNTNYTYEIISETTLSGSERLQEILDTKIDERYKSAINDMKKSMIMGRTLSSKKQRIYRTYKRYAKRLISYLHKRNSPLVYDVDILLCSERQICEFMERILMGFKPKTVRNYIIAAIKLLDSRLFVIETDPTCKEKVCQMTKVYNTLHKYLKECLNAMSQKVTEEKKLASENYSSETRADVVKQEYANKNCLASCQF